MGIGLGMGGDGISVGLMGCLMEHFCNSRLKTFRLSTLTLSPTLPYTLNLEHYPYLEDRWT